MNRSPRLTAGETYPNVREIGELTFDSIDWRSPTTVYLLFKLYRLVPGLEIWAEIEHHRAEFIVDDEEGNFQIVCYDQPDVEPLSDAVVQSWTQVIWGLLDDIGILRDGTRPEVNRDGPIPSWELTFALTFDWELAVQPH